jgi:spore maturation protein CgeB
MIDRDFPARKFVRRLRARRQRRRFDAFLDAELAGLRAGGYSEEALRARIRERARERSDWTGRAPRVVVFGTREWEQYGLWPAFAQLTELDYWEYRAPFTHPARLDAAWRASLAERFLGHVRARQAQQPVEVAFFLASAEHVAPELINQLHALGIWTVVMGLDDKHQFLPGPTERTAAQLQLAAACDLYMTTWTTGASIVWAHGGRPWCSAEGADPQFHHPVPAVRDLDAVFIGQAYGKRGELVRYLRLHDLDVGAFGAGWPGGFVSFEDQIALYARARVVLGYGGVRLMHEVQHLKGRDFEVPMCRALYLTTYNPELATHFDIGREILCYTSFQECREQIEWVRAHPEEADAMRVAAHARALHDHTWEARVRGLLALLTSGRGAAA